MISSEDYDFDVPPHYFDFANYYDTNEMEQIILANERWFTIDHYKTESENCKATLERTPLKKAENKVTNEIWGKPKHQKKRKLEELEKIEEESELRNPFHQEKKRKLESNLGPNPIIEVKAINGGIKPKGIIKKVKKFVKIEEKKELLEIGDGKACKDIVKEELKEGGRGIQIKVESSIIEEEKKVPLRKSKTQEKPIKFTIGKASKGTNYIQRNIQNIKRMQAKKTQPKPTPQINNSFQFGPNKSVPKRNPSKSRFNTTNLSKKFS